MTARHRDAAVTAAPAVGDGLAAASTRARIRAAAAHLFATRGFEATGIRELAERADISTASLYHYMGSKEDLLVEIMTVALTKLTQCARKLVAPQDPPAAALVTLVRTHVAMQIIYRPASVVTDKEVRALSEDRRQSVLDLRDAYEAMWTHALTSGQSAGTFRFQDAKIARLALLAMCNGVGDWFDSAGPLSVGEIADQFSDLALSMVQARRPNRRGGPTTDQVLSLVTLVCAENPG